MYRMIDANFNRCREGLRVIEDIVRFCLKLDFFEELKEVRHAVSKIEIKYEAKGILSRDSVNDPGNKPFESEKRKKEIKNLLSANFKRIEESLRVLEDTLMMIDPQDSEAVKEIRFKVYTLEKKVFNPFYKPFDLTLYLVTDSRHSAFPLEKTVEEALKGGVSIVQLREKHLFDKEIYESGRKVLEVCRKYKAPLLIDDRADIALALDADGVHIGQNDLPVSKVRKILGDGKIIGKSTHSLAQAQEAIQEEIDYFAFGPLFKTPTKDYAPVGLKEIEKIKTLSKESGKPVVFIGGLTLETLDEAIQNGVDAAAFVREIMGAKNPFKTAEFLLKKIKG